VRVFECSRTRTVAGRKPLGRFSELHSPSVHGFRPANPIEQRATSYQQPPQPVAHTPARGSGIRQQQCTASRKHRLVLKLISLTALSLQCTASREHRLVLKLIPFTALSIQCCVVGVQPEEEGAAPGPHRGGRGTTSPTLFAHTAPVHRRRRHHLPETVCSYCTCTPPPPPFVMPPSRA
jgi:hypothetical protein